MTNKFMSKRNKIRAQMKSRFYYWFWGAATVMVVSGQFYVGSGYRQMSKSLDIWFEETIRAMIQRLEGYHMNIPKSRPEGYYLPTPTPEYYNDDGVVYLKDLDPDDYILWKEIDADK